VEAECGPARELRWRGGHGRPSKGAAVQRAGRRSNQRSEGRTSMRQREHAKNRTLAIKCSKENPSMASQIPRRPTMPATRTHREPHAHSPQPQPTPPPHHRPQSDMARRGEGWPRRGANARTAAARDPFRRPDAVFAHEGGGFQWSLAAASGNKRHVEEVRPMAHAAVKISEGRKSGWISVEDFFPFSYYYFYFSLVFLLCKNLHTSVF
jgi:hypothetical protein